MQLLNISFEYLVVNYVIFVDLGRVVGLEYNVENLIEYFFSDILNSQIFDFF